jgi:ABC-type uncharacterized transport system permease subunit
MRYMGCLISAAAWPGLAGPISPWSTPTILSRESAGGRGFIGLASMIFGKWTPLGTGGASLLFGFGEAIKPYLPKVVPSQFIDMIPYILTILVLASAIGRATPPAKVGVPYVKE